MSIESDRQALTDLPMTQEMLQSLRESARLLSTHYSTQIEGNRLTEAQVKDVIEGGGRFPGRERDEAEVRNYFRALEFIEGMAESFTNVRHQASRQDSIGQRDQSAVLRKLSPPQRQALELFRARMEITAKDVATLFKVSPRQASRYCQQWVEQGFLAVADPAKRTRSYRLSTDYENLFSGN